MTTTAYPAVFAGYEAEREKHSAWAKRHYIDEFGLTPGAMLDAGCGEGFWGDLFADFGFDVTGFDLEPAYIAAGREKYPRLVLEVADVTEDLPFGLFDVVFCKMISPLYKPELDAAEAAVRNLLRHVAPEGLLLLSAYTDDSGLDRGGQFGGIFRHHSAVRYHEMIAAAGGKVVQASAVGCYLTWGVR